MQYFFKHEKLTGCFIKLKILFLSKVVIIAKKKTCHNDLILNDLNFNLIIKQCVVPVKYCFMRLNLTENCQKLQGSPVNFTLLFDSPIQVIGKCFVTLVYRTFLFDLQENAIERKNDQPLQRKALHKLLFSIQHLVLRVELLVYILFGFQGPH